MAKNKKDSKPSGTAQKKPKKPEKIPGLQVKVVTELGLPIEGFSVSVFLKEKGAKSGILLQIGDGSTEVPLDGDGKVNGTVIFNGPLWEMGAREGASVDWTVDSDGFVSNKGVSSLEAEGNEVKVSLNFPLEVHAPSKGWQGFSIELDGAKIKDGRTGDEDGLEDGRIYVKLPQSELIKDGLELKVYNPQGGAPLKTALPKSPRGWDVVQLGKSLEVKIP